MLLHKWAPVLDLAHLPNLVIDGLATDSRMVKKGYAFFAMRGATQDGHKHIPEAIEKGAALILSEEETCCRERSVVEPRLRQKLSHLGAVFYDHPSKAMKLTAITGTSGKTTTTYLLQHLLQTLGPCGRIGTTGIDGLHPPPPSQHTTPDALELQRLLAAFRQEDFKHVVMEASSHGIQQGRLEHLQFQCLLFTQLSPEHLDYHQSMEHYFEAKCRLFTELALREEPYPQIILNPSTAYSEALQARLKSKPLSVIQTPAWNSLAFQETSIQGDIPGIGAIQCPLFGPFNAENILLAAMAAKCLGVKPSAIQSSLETFPGVPGRMERVVQPFPFTVFIDYAHKPDALEKVLKALRKRPGKLSLVFGCGGDRDTSKRPLMGRIAVKYADRVVLTSDNPRTEDPDNILKAIFEGTKEGPGLVHVEEDRRAAIKWVLERAAPGETILIAGKGHEVTQETGTQKLPFSDKETVLESLGLKEKHSGR